MLAVEVEVEFQRKPFSFAFGGVWIADLEDNRVVFSELGVDCPSSSVVPIKNTVNVKLGTLVEGSTGIGQIQGLSSRSNLEV